MAKILLADDEEGLRMLLSRQLRRAGHEVTLAEDGMVALEHLQKERFELVVSDMKMPRLDGMGLLAKAAEIAPDTEFIILTGHGNLENAVEAFKTGNVYDYLLKPLDDINELNAVVDRALERKYLRAENTRLVAELQQRIAELEEAHKELARMAQTDGLTGLLNHRTIHGKLQELLEQKQPLSVILVDADDFKRLNDTYGHLMGDTALRHISGILQSCCPREAFLGRCGGDEFMVILPGLEAAQAMEVAEGIRHQIIENPLHTAEGNRLPIRLCFGVADTATAGFGPAGLITAADAALYESKRDGGDRVSLYVLDDDPNRDDLGRTAYSVLDGLVTAVDRKDRYTRAHSEHMTQYALTLAKALNMSENVCEIVRVAGLLHDVGKIGVPDSVLRKPGKLTDEEYEIMKTHVSLSAAIIHGLPNLSDILDAVAHHHERWDGKGYPYGKKGEEIPLLGRIMAIADAFSAMTLDRPYRAGLDVETALQEIERGAGTQFDPNLVPIFVRAVREQLKEQQEAQRRAA
jgi:diguanylate cyclase (GGDEF)-like protein/putative nucleotidyltransferase with HDIG domain